MQGSTLYPSVVGHEIVGEVVRVGDKVQSVRVGDIVGVGPNAWSCGKCSACDKDLEQYCVSEKTSTHGRLEDPDVPAA